MKNLQLKRLAQKMYIQCCNSESSNIARALQNVKNSSECPKMPQLLRETVPKGSSKQPSRPERLPCAKARSSPAPRTRWRLRQEDCSKRFPWRGNTEMTRMQGLRVPNYCVNSQAVARAQRVASLFPPDCRSVVLLKKDIGAEPIGLLKY